MKTCPKCGYEPGIDGGRLRALRRARGLSLRKMAAEVGVSLAYMQGVEVGKFPGARLLEPLAELLGVLHSELERR